MYSEDVQRQLAPVIEFLIQKGDRPSAEGMALLEQTDLSLVVPAGSEKAFALDSKGRVAGFKFSHQYADQRRLAAQRLCLY